MTPPRDAAGRAAPLHAGAACGASHRPREGTVFPGAGVHNTTGFHFSHQHKQPSYLPQKCSPTCSEKKPVLNVLGGKRK